MNGERTEACGRCSMSTVVDLAADGEGATGDDTGNGDGASDAAATSDPFAGGHIEVEESDVRAVSPSAWLGGVKRRIDDAVARLTYGKEGVADRREGRRRRER